jgi:hypothetical protein
MKAAEDVNHRWNIYLYSIITLCKQGLTVHLMSVRELLIYREQDCGSKFEWRERVLVMGHRPIRTSMQAYRKHCELPGDLKENLSHKRILVIFGDLALKIIQRTRF